MKSNGRILRGATFAGCLLLATCAQPGRGVDLPMPPRSTGTATMHAVHDEALRVVMRRLGASAFDRLPQELDDPRQGRAALEAVSARSQELAHAADEIGVIADQTGLTSDQQQVFAQIAVRLRDRALRLGAQADQGQIPLIRATMREIDDTCTSCHQLFRAPTPSARTP